MSRRNEGGCIKRESKIFWYTNHGEVSIEGQTHDKNLVGGWKSDGHFDASKKTREGVLGDEKRFLKPQWRGTFQREPGTNFHQASSIFKLLLYCFSGPWGIKYIWHQGKIESYTRTVD